MSDFDGEWNKWQNEHDDNDSKKGDGEGEIELEIDLSHFMLNEFARVCGVGNELFKTMHKAGYSEMSKRIADDLMKTWTEWNSKLSEAAKYVSLIQNKIDTITGETTEETDD